MCSIIPKTTGHIFLWFLDILPRIQWKIYQIRKIILNHILFVYFILHISSFLDLLGFYLDNYLHLLSTMFNFPRTYHSIRGRLQIELLTLILKSGRRESAAKCVSVCMKARMYVSVIICWMQYILKMSKIENISLYKAISLVFLTFDGLSYERKSKIEQLL